MQKDNNRNESGTLKKMKMKNLIIKSIISLVLTMFSQAQQLTQSVRGRVIDQDSKMPSVGAVVMVVGSDPLIATATDVDGYYKLENVPVGRITIKITSMGYEDRVIPNIQVTSGKEAIVNVDVVESIEELEEVVVKAEVDKKEALNEMSLVSARVISVEETKRLCRCYQRSFENGFLFCRSKW